MVKSHANKKTRSKAWMQRIDSMSQQKPAINDVAVEKRKVLAGTEDGWRIKAPALSEGLTWQKRIKGPHRGKITRLALASMKIRGAVDGRGLGGGEGGKKEIGKEREAISDFKLGAGRRIMGECETCGRGWTRLPSFGAHAPYVPVTDHLPKCLILLHFLLYSLGAVSGRRRRRRRQKSTEGGQKQCWWWESTKSFSRHNAPTLVTGEKNWHNHGTVFRWNISKTKFGGQVLHRRLTQSCYVASKGSSSVQTGSSWLPALRSKDYENEIQQLHCCKATTNAAFSVRFYSKVAEVAGATAARGPQCSRCQRGCRQTAIPPPSRGEDSAAPRRRMPSGSITDVPAGLTGGGRGGRECGSVIV